VNINDNKNKYRDGYDLIKKRTKCENQHFTFEPLCYTEYVNIWVNREKQHKNNMIHDNVLHINQLLLQMIQNGALMGNELKT